ncbi:MAG: class I SAM-dependent methyltransferase [Candidatus Paceibacterota bacterium]
MGKKWIINSKEYFPYSSKDIYLNWWLLNRKPRVSQSVIEFLYSPAFYAKKLLAAERKFLKFNKRIGTQNPKDVTAYLKSSIQTSRILGNATKRGEKIYAIKVPFHIKKWKTKNGRIVWDDIIFSDGSKAKLQSIDRNFLNVILSAICGRFYENGRIIDTRFIGSDEVAALDYREDIYGISRNEILDILKLYDLRTDSDSSVFLFSEKKEKIKEVVSQFISQFNAIAEKGLAGLIKTNQKSFDCLKGKTTDEKIKDIVETLSFCSHPYFPESVFAVACKNGLGNTVIDVIGIDSGWNKTHYIKSILDKWLFASLFWTSSNWIKLFFQYYKTPAIYHKYFGENTSSYRGRDIDWAIDYIDNFSKNKKVSIIDLGIGTGRELGLLKHNGNIKKIIGIDYSNTMIDFCCKRWKNFPIPLELILDDFISIKQASKKIKTVNGYKVFAIFFGTINNLLEEERIKMLLAVKKMMGKGDIFVIEFSKRPKDQNIEFNHPWLKFKNKKDVIGFYEAGVYAQLKWFWDASKDNFNTAPQFFYEKRTNNIIITVPGFGRCFFSHRFSESEVRSLVEKVGLYVEKINDGREMLTAIIKNKNI